jgi:PAS domain S-box-containing protein
MQTCNVNSNNILNENIKDVINFQTISDKWQATFDSISDIVMVLTIENVIIEANNAACKAFGLGKKELIGKKCHEIVQGTNAPIGKCPCVKILESKKEEVAEYTREGKHYKLIAWPILDENQEILAFVHVVKDITEQIKSEAELQANQHLSDLLLNSFPHPAMLINKDRIVIAANNIAEEIGVSSGKYCWSDFGKCLSLSERDQERAKINPHIKGIKCSFCQMEKAMDGNMNSINDPDICVSGRIYDTYWIPVNENMYLHYAIDVTERKQLEDERLKASKLESIGILAGGIAHDFNNILAAIMGNASLAKLSFDNQDELSEILKEIEKASIRATKLTQQLLTFAKGGAPVKEVIELSELLNETARFSLRGSNVQCHFSIAPDLWPVDVDKGQINQVINNLVINAKQAMPGGGAVSIKAKNVSINSTNNIPLSEGKYIRVSVSDKGAGIPPNQLDKIFDPYYTTKQMGSGLGLATVYSIINRHHGHIDVISEVGTGTTFSLYLKASLKQVEIEENREDIQEIVTGKILVMDDDEMLRRSIGSNLEDFGNEVAEASDGNEAIMLYKKALKAGKPFDVVIMDLTIPGGMGGKEATQKLLKIDPGVKAIVSSGYSNDQIISNYTGHGFCGFISKPYKIEDLRNVINRVMKM